MEIHELTWQRRRVEEATHSGFVGPTRTTALEFPPGSKESETYAINPEQFRSQLDAVRKLWHHTVEYQKQQLGVTNADMINQRSKGALRAAVNDIVEQRLLAGNPQLATISQFDQKAGTNYAEEITRLMNVIADDPGSSGTDQAWYRLLLKIQAVQWMAIKGVPEAAAQQSTTKLTTQGEIERQKFAGAAQQALGAVPGIRTMPVPPTGNPHLNALLAAMGILRGYVPPQPEQQQ